MSYYNTVAAERARTGKLKGGIRLIGAEHGAVLGCHCGVTAIEKKEFSEKDDVHETQEGFLVIKGHGEARVGGELIELIRGVAFFAPSNVPHEIRCHEDCDCLEIFWFHSAVLPGSVPEVKTSLHNSIQEVSGQEMGPGRLLGPENGCVDSCCAGVALYPHMDYVQKGCHDDQEGFFVLEGTGFAKVGDEEFPVAPGTSFIAPAGTWHSLRRNEDCPYVAVFWFHSAV